MEKRNSQLEHGHPIEQTRGFFARATQVWLAVNNNTGIISLVHEVDNGNVLHGQVSLSALKQRASDTLRVSAYFSDASQNFAMHKISLVSF